jgi:hypothetical protein
LLGPRARRAGAARGLEFMESHKLKVAILRLLLAVIAGLGLVGVSGCVSTPPSEDAVSTLPWNRPASWEGRGPLGGMMMMNGAR